MNVWLQILDTAGALLVLLGAAICLLGVIGMLRLPDVLSRSHAATKPQTLGILLVLAGVALRLRSGMDLATLSLIGFFQMLTGPVASHLVARSAYRTGQVQHEELLFDELDEQLTDGKQPPGPA
ncbi:monovalent cation/H(+) antiporter subunit G [Streptomyces microflavus]|uniref:Monovalent cation/H(+) antiporter subunit G n=5 Tax=Streptomyces microflavus subgroup TaxID=1482601 RepID=A0A6N9VII3_STRMI|nr:MULTISPECIES: monovalent cation/H(+) antiporter subunit G [Streptomyces]MBK3582778.1 monovalent cation/H(+) antiporter subunit G [Streptomyces sp. MBT57]AGK80786.1 Monovalent cation/proton antiporter [Streptomyces microflavus DSM 40593]MBK5991188.1 monovalent cation/H(+) antiporter subunit G [Streptomyces sp. MBT58]MBW3361833.1 monovalent cation/H(+) antiporter subunit G [Streptomyces sp. 09ZI22]MCX4655863.1 monovalent cation/H(+) antiporter subunit G [Streptomyces microflavus]